MARFECALDQLDPWSATETEFWVANAAQLRRAMQLWPCWHADVDDDLPPLPTVLDIVERLGCRAAGYSCAETESLWATGLVLSRRQLVRLTHVAAEWSTGTDLRQGPDGLLTLWW